MLIRAPLLSAFMAAATLAFGHADAFAQDSTPLVLRVPASTRAMALGNAFPVGDRDSDGIFYNAAFFETHRGFGAHVQRWDAGSTLVTASAGAEWWGGTLAIGVQALSFGTIAPGSFDERTLFGDGLVAAAQHAALLSFGRRVGGRVRFAAGAKYVSDRVGLTRRELGAVDLATATSLGVVQLGVSVHDLDPRLRLATDGSRLPTRAAVRAATRARPTGPFDIALAARVEHRLDTFRTGGGAGVEVHWWPIVGRTFTGRLGVRDHEPGGSPLTFGAGFMGDRFGLDWAYREVGAEGGTHRFGVRYR
jgi:hypothetical protein